VIRCSIRFSGAARMGVNGPVFFSFLLGFACLFARACAIVLILVEESR